MAATSLRDFVVGPEQMFFLADALRTSRPPPAAAPRRATVAESVQATARRLESEAWAARQAEERADELQRSAAALTRRHEVKRRRELEREVDAARREAEDGASGEKRRRFLERAEPFLREERRQQFCRPQGSSGSGGGGAAAPWEDEVLEEYRVRLEGAAAKFEIQNGDACQECQEPMQLHSALSLLVCQRCGAARPFLDATSSLLGYAEDGNYEFGSFSYKRINHFAEWLASIQAKETLEIPQGTLNLIMERLVVDRAACDEDVTVQRVREALKKLKLRRYYEHVQLIACKLTGRAPPRMTPEMEERLKVYFLAASASFQRSCPPEKKNLTSYGVVLYKLCELLGYHDFLPCFAALKGAEKMARVEAMWAKICEDLDWEVVRR